MTPLSDLHIHSIYSDGNLTPSELAKTFAKRNASVIALTDHDTVTGVKEMSEACKEFGMINIPGVEISTYHDLEIHILGYNMDMTNNSFVQFMDALSKKRNERVQMILHKLKLHGINISYEQVLKCSTASVSRFHIARVMANSKYGDGTVHGCYKRYLDYGKPCYVPHFVSEPENAIKIIKKAGGIAVLAHPMRLELKRQDIENLIKRLANNGLDGIEAEYRDNKDFVKFAEDNNLLITAGGDFHSDNSVPYLRPMRMNLRKALNV